MVRDQTGRICARNKKSSTPHSEYPQNNNNSPISSSGRVAMMFTIRKMIAKIGDENLNIGDENLNIGDQMLNFSIWVTRI